MKLINEWLDIMEKDLEDDHGGCRVNGVLSCFGYKEKFNHGCPPCEQCKKESQEIIAKIRKEVSEHTAEHINLDGLSLLKDKLKEKYNALFNNEVTEYGRGELDVFTLTFCLIDDIMKKQSLENKTSDTQKDNVNRPKHQNITIRNLVEVGYFKFNVKLDDSYYEFDCLPDDFIDFVYGEDFLNQEVIAITQGTDGKMYVTLKEKQDD